MVKAFIVLCTILFPVRLLLAQDEPAHSDTQRVSHLLEAAHVYVMRPGAEKHDMDSALYFITDATQLARRLNEPLWQARCYLLYSQLYRESGDKEKGRSYIDQAISIFTKYGRKEELGDTYMEFSLYYDVWSPAEWPSRMKYAEMAERLYEQNGNKQKQAAALENLGDLCQIGRKDSIALQDLDKALAIYQSIQHKHLEGIYSLIGTIFYNEDNLYQALKYGLLAAQTAEKVNADGAQLVSIYNRVGLTYYRLTQYQEANNYFNRAYSLALGNRDTANARVIAPNIITSYLRLGRQQELITFLEGATYLYKNRPLYSKAIYVSSLIQAHMLTNDVKKAAPLVDELLRLIGDSTGTIARFLHKAIIPYYLAAGEYRKMYKYLPAYDSICRKENLIADLGDNYLWWSKADSALGNHTAALAHYKLYKEASDSSLRLTASRQINQLHIQYESFKKDQAIAAKENNIQLLTEQAKLQQEQLRRNKVIKNMTFGLIALLLIILGLLVNGYRLKQSRNEKLQQVVKQKDSLLIEKEWLLKEVHHRVKNNMQVVMSLLNTQSLYLENDALKAIKESQHRLQAMALIHQKLYQGENVFFIDMSSYIGDLTDYLRDCHDSDPYVCYTLDIDQIELNVSQAVPVGLILNEGITNAMKYAFPGGTKGSIDIEMKKTSTGDVQLRIRDNGIGLPIGQKPEKEHSIGLNLIKGLVRQLEGNVKFISDNGVCIQIAFPGAAVIKPSLRKETPVKI